MIWSTFAIIAALLVVLVAYLYKKLTIGFDVFEKQGIPYLQPRAIFGTQFSLIFKRVTISDFLKDACNKFSGARIIGLFDRHNPIYLINDAELIKQIGVKDFEYFTDNKIDELLGNNLASLKGQKWKDMRATLSPIFTGRKMRQMFDLLPEIGKQMAEYFKNVGENERVFEMKDVFGRFALDAIASTNFGVKIDSLKEKNNYFYTKVLAMVNFQTFTGYLRFVAAFWFPIFAKVLKIQIIPKSRTQFFIDLVRDTEKTREEKGIYRPDLVNMLMQIKKGQLEQEENDTETDSIGFATVEEADLGKITKRNWSDKELLSQAFIFFFAGFETVSLVTSFIAYELAINQDVQSKLIAEIDEVSKKLESEGKELTYEILQTMKYLDMVVTEGLRLWTPADMVDRKCIKDYKLKNDQGEEITIPKGTMIWLAIGPIHASEKYYENPDKFDPERFNEENKHKIVNGAYIPFGIGPRNCIGSRFALMEVKAALYYILKDFSFEQTEKTKVPMVLAKGMTNGKRSEHGIWLKLKKRN